MMKRQALALGLTLGLLSGLAGSSVPAHAWGKQNAQTVQKDDSTYTYVSKVFDKLQAHWEPAAYEQTMGNTLLTFVLNEDGTLNSSKVKSTDVDNGSGQKAIDFVKNNAPFGKFPSTLKDNLLEFKFKITSDSLQMVSYQIVTTQDTKEPVVKYNSPSNGATLGASLFYMAAQAPITGKVSWKTPDEQTGSEESMALYVNEVQDRIQKNWHLPEGVSSSERAVAYLMIDRDGTLLSALLKQSSGNKLVDQAAMNAVTQSAPYNRVPSSAVSLPVEIEYVFERIAPEPVIDQE